jgi:citrate lyase subunit beta/citryl-CoA lyase
MPGSNERALEKGRTLDTDGIILDLEDAVSPGQKAEAREKVVTALEEGGYGHRELLLRVNGLMTEWGEDDLRAAAQAGAHGVLLPKVEDTQTVRRAEAILVEHGAPDDLTIWCMMETPRGILNAPAIAEASSRLAGFVMGTSDLAKDLHASHTPLRLPLLVGLGTCLLAARAAGIVILDGVYLDLNDEDGFRASCQQGVELGFDGKTLIHPKQLGPCNEAFAPGEDEVSFARQIIEAHAEAAKEGKGVVLVDGKLIESLHVENAHRLVAMADAIAKRG